ncbi:MAG: sugar ABC transporter permease [Clostridia bacterium]|nr:sugar ABC transporter permease [Clostridia bacterium]
MAEKTVAAPAPAKAPKKNRRKGLSLERKKSLFGYVFVSPIIIGMIAIYIPVLVQSCIYSFTENAGRYGEDYKFVGWQNYHDALFVESGFLQNVYSSTVALLPQIFIILIFAFFMANILNQNFRGRSVARVIFFIPVVLSTGIVTYFDNLSSMTDIYEGGDKLDIGGAAASTFDFVEIEAMLLSALGNSGLATIISGAIGSLYTVITSSGVQMLIFLSGLQSISINMYEAAKVEGATGWEVFWKISFPMISPLILVNLLYTVIDLFTSVDNATISFIAKYYENVATYSIASAFSWMYTILLLLFVGIVFVLVQKLIVYQD